MTMTRKTITISDSMEDWIKGQISNGRYASDSEYFRDLIRRDQERRAAEASIRRMLDEAEQSGLSNRTMEEIKSDVERRMRAEGKWPSTD